MSNSLYFWALKHSGVYVSSGPREWFANLLLRTVFQSRHQLEKARAQLKFMEREAKRYRKKLDNLYVIIAEYEAVGEAATEVLDNPQIDKILAREAVAYGDDSEEGV